jgi:NADH-ubiquinone oxidoreductase chain 2
MFNFIRGGLIYTYTGLTNLESIYTLVSVSEGHNLVQGIVLGLVLTGVGFLFKVAAAPFHNWSPDVYNDVPTIVTTWLTVMPKITILIFLLDLQSGSIIASLPTIEASMPAFITDVSAAHSASSFYVFKNLLLICSVLSLIIGTVVGLAQQKIKRLFAYSTISHVGFLLLSMAINTEQSLESFLFYLVQYSLTNVNTFFILLAFGYVLFGAKSPDKNKSNTPHPSGLRNSQNTSDIELISDLKGQFFNQPILSLSFAVCLFSMAGVPPLLGFFGKQSVLYASMSTGYYFLSLVAIVVSVISASYYLRIIRVVFFDASTDSTITNSTVATESTIANKVLANAELMNKSIIQNSHSFVIAILTLSIILFFIKPTLVLNSIQLLALSMYNI